MSVGTKEDCETIANVLSGMHVSIMENAAVSLAANPDGDVGVVLLFTSCCGISAYSMSLEAAQEMIEGLNGAFEHLAKTRGGPNAN